MGHVHGEVPDRTVSDGGAPPQPPLPPFTGVEEGPMRGDLRRQIEALELQLTRLKSDAFPWEPVRTSPTRGPAMLGAAELELVRDELVETLERLRRRLLDEELGANRGEAP